VPMTRPIAAAFLLVLLTVAAAWPCTIFSGRTADGITWVGNNEDYIFDFGTYLNVLPREGELLGALTFTYGRPESFIQGGMNEKCLFLDFNALPAVPDSEYAGWGEKTDFPGGDRALVLHILRTCSTVPDVVKLLRRYRLPCLLGGQMHVADGRGNLAIVNADSMCLAQGGWQISTNFNVCTKRGSPEETSCWRFPIAERMMIERGVSLESFRDIAEATQQPRAVSTIYTTIVNLTTGEFYLYYGGDYQNPYRFKVRELLAKGRRSYLMRSLLPDAPVTQTWETYRAKGAKEAVRVLEQSYGGLTGERQAVILRYAFLSCLLLANDYPSAQTFFDAWRGLDGGKHVATSLYGAYVRLTTGDFTGAADLLAKQIAADSSSVEVVRRMYLPGEQSLLARLRGTAPPGANVRFELRGHQDAKFVCVYGLALAPLPSVLLRTPEGWAGDFALPSGKHHYAFVVDGKLILDPANPQHEIAEGVDVAQDLSVKEVP
jgi:hypothetical protein